MVTMEMLLRLQYKRSMQPERGTTYARIAAAKLRIGWRSAKPRPNMDGCVVISRIGRHMQTTGRMVILVIDEM